MSKGAGCGGVESLSRGWGLCPGWFGLGVSVYGGLCPGVSLFWESLSRWWGLFPGRVSVYGVSLFRAVAVYREVSVQVSLCPGVSVQEGSLSRRGLCPGGVSVQEGSLSRGSLRGSLSREGLCLGRPLSG